VLQAFAINGGSLTNNLLLNYVQIFVNTQNYLRFLLHCVDCPNESNWFIWFQCKTCRLKVLMETELLILV